MPKSPRAGQLFLGLTFWISHQVPDRTKFKKSLQHHGGTVLDQESADSYNLVNPEKQKTSLTSTYYDYKFITDSLEQKRLLDENDYEVRGNHPVDRIPGSTSTLPKGTRTRFTAEDDQILYNWVEPLRRNDGYYKGNQIFEQLARVHPHHPYQSWRDHYIKFVMNRTDMELTEHVQLDNGRNDEPVERPAKRRRVRENLPLEADHFNAEIAPTTVIDSVEETVHQVEGPMPPRNGVHEGAGNPEQRTASSREAPEDSGQLNLEDDSSKHDSLFCTPDREVQGLSHDRYLQTSLGNQGFTFDEARRLYNAVPAICNTSPGQLEVSWTTMASEWNKHSVEAWKMYYKNHVLPEYKHANSITTQDDLDAHMAYLVAQQSGSIPENIEAHSTYQAVDTRNETEDSAKLVPEPVLSHDVDKSIDDSDAAEHVRTEPEKEASSSSDSKSSAAQRVAVTANEGRKRAIQQVNKDNAHSPPVVPVAPVTTPLSQKKKLFGRTFDLNGSLSQTQPSFITQLQIASVNLDITSSVPVQSSVNSTGKTNTTSSSLSLPTVYKPPQSFQLPPQSLSTSQESAQNKSALQTQEVVTKVPEEPELPERLMNIVVHDAINLLDDERTDSEPDLAEHPSSDTGSEYTAFETGIERSQLWETRSQSDGEMTELSGDEPPQNRLRINRRQTTPLRQQSPSEQTEFTDEEGTGSPQIKATSHEIQDEYARIETQALFERPTQSEPSLFDLPDPDGGWETLGIIEDPDEAIETVELPDGYPLNERQSVSTSESLVLPGSAQMIPVAVDQKITPVTELAMSAERVNLETIVRKSPSIRIKEETHIPQHSLGMPRPTSRTSDSVRRQSTTSSVNPNVSILSTTRFGQESTLASWMITQQDKYRELPDMVFKRLASTASQAINLNSITTATLLLEKLVDNFLAYEDHRQSEYKQRNPGSGKRLKAVTALSSAQAKQMLPTDIRGVWTPEDDDRLTSSSRASIMQNETKHGADGVKERIEFLKNRYNLKTDGNSPTKTAATPSSSKRRR